jgi:hypothetical protein
MRRQLQVTDSQTVWCHRLGLGKRSSVTEKHTISTPSSSWQMYVATYAYAAGYACLASINHSTCFNDQNPKPRSFFFLSSLYIVTHSSLVYNSAHANPTNSSKLKKPVKKGKKRINHV